MSINIKKFCNTHNFKFLDNLTNNEKNEIQNVLSMVDSRKIKIDTIVVFELLKTYFLKEKETRDSSWIIKNIIGKPGKEGSAYIVYKKGYPEKEYVMKAFRQKKSFENIRKEVKFQTIASIYDISPKIYEYGSKPTPYIIMDKMNGGNILDVIKKQKGTLTLDQQKQLIKIFETLDKLGIKQGDRNLLNIMFNDGKMYIIDYGFGKYLEKNETNFTSLKLMMTTMSGFQSYLIETPMLFLPYLEEQYKNYWLTRNKRFK
jgi:predicted Ser/Thr protein kinase